MNGEIITSHHHSLSAAETWIDDRIQEASERAEPDGLEGFHFEHDRELKSFEVVFVESRLPSYQATYDHDDC